MSFEIVEYKLVTAALSDRGSFDREINTLIKQGWQPYGQPFASVAVGTMLHQSMVQYKKEK